MIEYIKSSQAGEYVSSFCGGTRSKGDLPPPVKEAPGGLIVPPPPAKKCCSWGCFGKCCGICLLTTVVIGASAWFLLPKPPIEELDASYYSPSVVTFCERTVTDASTYKTSFTTWSEPAQARNRGVKSLFSYVKKGTDKTVMEFAFFDSARDVVFPPQSLYAGTPETDFCVVWGAWTPSMKSTTEGFAGVHYQFPAEQGGFIRPPGSKGYEASGPPMMMVSKRWIYPGQMELYLSQTHVIGGMEWLQAPALVSMIEFVAADDPSAVWALRLFTDLSGFFVRRVE